MTLSLLLLAAPLVAGLAPSPAGSVRVARRALPPRVSMHGGAHAAALELALHEEEEAGLLATPRQAVEGVRNTVRTFRKHAFSPRLSSKSASYREETGEGARITLVGAALNLLLSCGKALAGFYGNSAAMMSDAAHSFSDLISDGLTLFALRIGSLPPDDDHPYGHGRFEAIGCLGIGSLLMVTAASFGSSALAAARVPNLAPPTPIALWAAIASILCKELLFRATERVGKKLGSTVIMANAWHHRSDAFSSVVAVVGIVGALCGWPLLDPLCGIAVAVLVGFMGGQIVADALYRLSDTADPVLTKHIVEKAKEVQGVLGVGGARLRWMSSNVAMADLSVMVGPTTTASAAQRLAGQVRSALMEEMPDLAEVLVRTQTMCPLLDAKSQAPLPRLEIETRVENVLLRLPAVHSVPTVSVRYINGGELAVDVALEIASEREDMSMSDLREMAVEARKMLLDQVEPLVHASISTRLAG